jgi:hypothetical protein
MLLLTGMDSVQCAGADAAAPDAGAAAAAAAVAASISAIRDVLKALKRASSWLYCPRHLFISCDDRGAEDTAAARST